MNEIFSFSGEKRPVILVGNKADLIPRDSKKYLDNVKNCLRCAAEDVGLDKTKIIDVHLVSAATGYGVEDLISTVFRSWGNKGKWPTDYYKFLKVGLSC